MMKQVIRRIFVLLAMNSFALLANAQDSCINHWETLIYESDDWQYAVDSAFQDQGWKLVSYDASLWNKGKGGIGYGDNDDVTIVPNCKILYLRKKFILLDTGVICKALLSIDYDDAFVAWLNGGEIARSGITDAVPDANSPVALHEANMYAGGHPENFIIHQDSLLKYLKSGENILAFQVHNQSVTSSDLTSRIYFSIAVSSSDQMYGPVAEKIILPPSINEGFDIPLISIETNGNTVNRDSKITADMKIIHNGNGFLNHLSDSGNVYSGKIGIKIRGSSSSGFPQKSYTLETRNSSGDNRNVSLLDMPSENDWLLISNYYDRSFARNFLSHEIFRGMGHYSPRVRHCEVVMNGEYRGVYLLMEKIKVDKGRVDISKLKSYENSGDDLTGGYIIKCDNYERDGSDSWPVQFPEIEEKNWSAVEARFVYVHPAPDSITSKQKGYIQTFIETSRDVLYNDDFKEPIKGYYSYFDVPSFVDYLIVSEISRNGDAYKKSRFFYKDKESKNGLLHAGPPWDFDWAWKNLFFQPDDGSGWVHNYEAYGYGDVQPVRYMNQMLLDPNFSNEVYNRYFRFRQTVLHYDTLSHKIDSIVNYLSNAQVRHFEQWDILNDQSGDPDAHVPDSYADEIDYLKDWILQRITWLDNNMTKFKRDEIPSYSVAESTSLFFRVFPIPASDQVYLESNEPIHKIEVLTTAGKVLFADDIGGKRACTINIQSLNPGIYLVRITIQNQVHIRKIIKM
ncbi:MAG: CotH kinase family protein [Bacteroidales bacterium]